MADEQGHIRIGGVPVRVDWSFWLLAVLLGYQAREGWLLVAWVAIVLVSILVHELGHAFTMRAFQQRPHVLLYAFGGVTYGDAAPRSRAESIIISVAGPLSALFLLGIPAYLLKDGAWAAETYNRYVIVHDIAWVNILWSVLNLVPVLPLDGGNVAAVLFGERPARIMSLVVAGGGAFYFLQNDNQFGALFAAMFAVMNFAALSRDRQPAQRTAQRPVPRPVQLADVGRGGDDVASLVNAYLEPTVRPTRSRCRGRGRSVGQGAARRDAATAIRSCGRASRNGVAQPPASRGVLPGGGHRRATAVHRRPARPGAARVRRRDRAGARR